MKSTVEQLSPTRVRINVEVPFTELQPDFDRAYMKDMVKDHKHDVSEFKKEAKKAKDPDVQKFAQSTLPTLEEHLAMAQKTDDVVQGSKRTGNRETGSTKK